MSQPELIGCDDFVLRHDDGGADSSPPSPLKDETQLCFQWEADTGLPAAQMPLLGQGKVPLSLYPVLSRMTGCKPWMWGERIAGRPLWKSEVRHLAERGGLATWDGLARRRKPRKDWRISLADTRTGENGHRAAVKRALWYRTVAYILKALRRGWRRDPIAFPDLLRMACEAVFGTGRPYQNGKAWAAFKRWVLAAVEKCQATRHNPANAPVNNSENSVATPPAAPLYKTRAGIDTAQRACPSDIEKTRLIVPGTDTRGYQETPPENIEQKTGSSRRPTFRRASRGEAGDVHAGLVGGIAGEAARHRAKMTGLAKQALPALLAAGHPDAPEQRRWLVGWACHWLGQGWDATALVSLCQSVTASWRAVPAATVKGLRARLQAAAERDARNPAMRFRPVRKFRRPGQIRTPDTDARLANYRARLATEPDPDIRASLAAVIRRLSAAT